MFLIVVGTGVMGRLIAGMAKEDGAFDRVLGLEPLGGSWPEEKVDLIIDFSHPKAIKGIYDYCRKHGGNIPVVIGATGQGQEEEEVIRLLGKICPVDRRSNFSLGIETMNHLTKECKDFLEGSGRHFDVGILEAHHSRKLDAPSGTALTLCQMAGISQELGQVASLRLGTLFGQHKAYFALEDEVIEITHTAYSKKIFAKGALEAGKELARKNSQND